MKANRNILSGYVEKAHISDFQFENQRRTFTSYGYAVDPSTNNEEAVTDNIVGMSRLKSFKYNFICDSKYNCNLKLYIIILNNKQPRPHSKYFS